MASVSALGPPIPPQRVQAIMPSPRRDAPVEAPPPAAGTATGVAGGLTGSARPGFGAETGAALLALQPDAPPASQLQPARATAPPDQPRTRPIPAALSAEPAPPDQQATAALAAEASEEVLAEVATEPPSRATQERAIAAYAARGDQPPAGWEVALAA